MTPGTRANPRLDDGEVNAPQIESVNETFATGSGTPEAVTAAQSSQKVVLAIEVVEKEDEPGRVEVHQTQLTTASVEKTLAKIESALSVLTEVMRTQAESKQNVQKSMDKMGAADKDGRSEEEIEKDAVVEHETYLAHVAFKIYQKGMESSRCRRIGDGSFFAAKRTWDRLLNDFPVTTLTKKRLLPQAFEGDARYVFGEVAGLNPNLHCDELWVMLEKRLCNDVHQSALRDKIFTLRWNDKKESFEKFSTRLRSAALSLPGVIDGGILLNCLKAGLPVRLQDQAALVSGNFDEVVSRVSCLSTAQMYKGEPVREVGKPRRTNAPTYTPDQEPVNANVRGEGAQQPADNSDRFAHVKCHYCQQMGHISRFCPKKKADKLKSGEEQADQPSPAGPKNDQN